MMGETPFLTVLGGGVKEYPSICFYPRCMSMQTRTVGGAGLKVNSSEYSMCTIVTRVQKPLDDY